MITPMKLPEFDRIVVAACAVLGRKFDTPDARAMLWAIGRQEGRMYHRRQINGPARGLWQFEQGGGVKGVMSHRVSAELADRLCQAQGVSPEIKAAYQALERDDVLACGFARLLLYTDPRPLPRAILSSEDIAWDYYERNWRPGKPHPETWPAFWKEATTYARSWK